MYVIFPADEVVYLSYGRLIVVPANSNSENSQNPIRTNSIPLENNSSVTPLNTYCSTRSKRSIPNESIPGPSRIEYNLVNSQPSTSRGNNQVYVDTKISQESKSTSETKIPLESKPKKRSLRLNFNLLKKNKSKNSESQTPYTPRVRYSIGHKDQVRSTTPPSEAFKKYCYISPGEPEANKSLVKQPSSESKKYSPEIIKNLPFSSKRSSSSSKTSKPSTSIKEDQESKESSKHSSSSSKSKQEKSSPVPYCNNTSGPKKFQSEIQKEVTKERKRSTSTNLSADVFYPLSTSREKNLVEPSPEPKLKTRSSSFRLSLRRSKTPDISLSLPIRPERKKEKKPVKSKSVSERKLSFSDFLVVSREKPSEPLPEVVVTSDREPGSFQRDKSPVLGFFRKTPSPKNLGRDRTPNLNRESGFYRNQNLLPEAQREDSPRPTSTGQKHTSGEGSIMRLAIFNANTTNIIISLAILTFYRLKQLIV